MSAPVAFHRFALGLIAVAALAGCGGDTGRGEDAELYVGGMDGRGSVIRPGRDANAAYGAALDLKAKGDCKGAIVKLRSVANLGPGYEGAQTNLGQCLLQLAGASDLSSDYLDGLTWLRRAADAGWPEAQLQLAEAHALGPTIIRNGEEAAYWLALYDANNGKLRISFVAPDPATVAAVRNRLTPAEKAAGEKRAASWERKVWLPPAAANGGPGLSRREVRMPGGGSPQ